jgi:hypothetical protein
VPDVAGSQPDPYPPGYIPPRVPQYDPSLTAPPAQPKIVPPAADYPPGYIPPSLQMPPPESAPSADAAPTTARRATSLPEFAHNFQPRAGKHQVLIVHPSTREAVPVTFTLPQGTVRQVLLGRNEMGFNYGREQVWIHFLSDGQVRVTN